MFCESAYVSSAPSRQLVYSSGIGIIKGLFERIAQYQRRHCGCKPRTSLSDMRAFILRGGLTGPLFSDRASMALHCGVWAGAMGKGDLSAPGTEPESGGGIRRFVGTRRGGPGPGVAHGWVIPGGSESCRSRRGLQWRRGWSRARRTGGTW